MLKKEQQISIRKIILSLRFLYRNYPIINYLVRWIPICIILSLCVGTISALFLKSLDFVTTYREAHRTIIFFLPLAGLFIGLLYHYWGGRSAEGNNLLLDAIHQSDKVKIPFRMAPLVFLTTVITHLFGGSAGREGTALQMAGAIASALQKVFRLSKSDIHILLISATAAGFGSVFGTPLAGAVFGLEFYRIGKLRYEGLFPALIASILSDMVARAWQVEHTEYPLLSVPDFSILNILYTLLAGIAFGVCAVLFSKAMHNGSLLFKKWIKYPPFRPFVGGIVLVMCIWALGSTDYVGLGIPLIIKSFHNPLPEYSFLLKLGLTVLTLSSGFKGGEVTPLFFIGATLGNLLSLVIPLPIGLLAGIGFVSVFSGATNTPLACILMAIELFGAECGIYAAIACVTAYMVSGHTGIYAKQLIGEPKFSKYRTEKEKYIEQVRR